MSRPRRSLALLILTACGPAEAPAPQPEPAATPVTLTIVGTSDLHGHLRALPLLAGHLNGLRRARANDGGGVVLVDAGDMFQGTLESSLDEGASVVAAYGALGYDAVAIGNHEYDYGPVGPKTTAREPGDDPRGALRARITSAPYAFLSSNLRGDDVHPALGLPATLIDRAGVQVGIVGVTTEDTPHTTIAANFTGLAIAPLDEAIAAQARSLRARGAAVVVVAAHAGGRCTDLTAPDDLASCDPAQEIMRVARALPPGLVDVIVAGHTHQAMAHRVNGIAILQSYANGVAFGRVDLEVSGRTVVKTTIHPPRRLCSEREASPEVGCVSVDERGAAVMPDPAIAAVITGALTRADVLRNEPLGPKLQADFVVGHRHENPPGNLFTDLMLRARPGVDVAILNGGGLRSTLPAGPLRYGALYQALPFDNRFARVRLRADQLAAMIAVGLGGGPWLSLAGLTVNAECKDARLVVTLLRDGEPLAPDAPLELLTSDFLATGGDKLFAAMGEPGPAAITIEDDPPLREVIAEQLRALGDVELVPATYFEPARPRVKFPGELPLRCAPAG
ncbi:MAG TPA: 5'-nucleotidase C-terminal domain-containing protein [Nannocystis sp.]